MCIYMGFSFVFIGNKRHLVATYLTDEYGVSSLFWEDSGVPWIGKMSYQSRSSSSSSSSIIFFFFFFLFFYLFLFYLFFFFFFFFFFFYFLFYFFCFSLFFFFFFFFPFPVPSSLSDPSPLFLIRLLFSFACSFLSSLLLVFVSCSFKSVPSSSCL